jgi:hypothetical protein
MRRKGLDVLDCDQAGIRRHDDHAVFGRAWKLKRLLVTHDADFLDDRAFPFSRCSGLLVVPAFPERVSLEFGSLLAGALDLIRKGAMIWFYTKMVVRRDFVVRVRTWERREGHAVAWDHVLPNAKKWRPTS